MNKSGIKCDKITPSFIQAYKKWWTDTVKRYEKEVSKETLEREKSAKIEFVPKDLEEKLQITQLDVVIKHLHAKFSKEFPWYSTDLKTFRSAYIHHPLGWDFTLNNGKSEGWGKEFMLNYLEKTFEKISSYANNI